MFTKKLVFSAVLGQKLAAILCPTASKFTTNTPRHPQKLPSLMCFQALIGSLRPTTDFETLNKDPDHVFKFKRGIISNMSIFIFAHTATFSFHKLKHQVGVFFRVSKSVVGLKLPIRA